MSNVYNTEPPTNGKVVLHTSHGDIDVELWPKEAPKACRNFLQLCVDGFYDGLPFHRIMKGVIAQTGAVSGDVSGAGPDVYSGAVNYLAEQHSRLRFQHRGQVAMAGPRGSQFFMTLGKADWLNGKHCIFGKVTGDSIYNLLQVGEVDTDAHDVPTDDPPPRVISVEILSMGPFEELAPRRDSKRAVKEREAAAAAETAAAGTGKSRPGLSGRAGPTTAVLSFRTDDEDDQEVDGGLRNSARGDLVGAGRAVFAGAVSNTHVSLARNPPPAPAAAIAAKAHASGGHGQGVATERVQPDEERLRPKVIHSASNAAGIAAVDAAAEYSKLREQVKSSRRALALAKDDGAVAKEAEVAGVDMMTPLQAMRAKYVRGKRARGDREAETLARLASFQGTLRTALASQPEAPTNGDAYHGQVLENEDLNMVVSGAEGVVVKGKESPSLGWAATTGLKFKKHIDDSYKGFGYGAGFGQGEGRADGSTRQTIAVEVEDAEEDGLMTLDPLAESTNADSDAQSHRGRWGPPPSLAHAAPPSIAANVHEIADRIRRDLIAGAALDAIANGSTLSGAYRVEPQAGSLTGREGASHRERFRDRPQDKQSSRSTERNREYRR